MPRRVIQILLVLLGGPALAFLIVLLGCEGSAPLGTMCGHNILTSLVLITLAAWFVLSVAVSLLNGLREER